MNIYVWPFIEHGHLVLHPSTPLEGSINMYVN